MIATSSFIEKPKNVCYDGEDNDEEILYVIRRSSITNIPWILLAAVFIVLPFFFGPFLRTFRLDGQPLVSLVFITTFTIFWYVFTFGFFFYNFLNWFFNVYIITSKKIVDIDFVGLIYKNISEAALFNVEDVTSEVKGTFGVVFNIGHVYIQTAAERREFEFHSIYNPARVRDIISDLVAQTKKNGNN